MNRIVEITASNMTNIVSDAYFDCQFKGNEDISNLVAVDGLYFNYAFHPKRLEEYRNIVILLLDELPKDIEKGCSYSRISLNKNGEQWTNSTIVIDRLVSLAIGLGLMRFCYARYLWSKLPDGLPYVTTNMN